ncbi:MAG: phenylalanine--tRNA ligase subunit alpha [Candidatus Freyarchaeota archaeon]|nr:phenylalanine--tRNA ligase subunit alpha [Candidatus Jordarchaeia archaeon]MBS7267401.1 phenylalanine--tRNA ligase subunit alpha [Candidatus Jordarchaeia archaeon]MBS7278706.1 phenylalanine--tRNA ligase subunit alpha [Candidatus Jordarchaeia archaeon]
MVKEQVKLREIELKILKALNKSKGETTISDLEKETGLDHVAVARASAWLGEKGLVEQEETQKLYVEILKEGSKYVEEGLPERRLLNIILKLGGNATLSQLSKEASFSEEELKIALGWLRRKNWAEFKKQDSETLIHVREQPPLGDDENLLKLLNDRGVVEESQLPNEMKKMLDSLQKRNVIKTRQEKVRSLLITEEGRRLVQSGVSIVEEVSNLTSDLIKSGKWRSTKFRKYDVEAPVATIHPGKIHPVAELINEIREIFLNLGFTEIRGPFVESAFWNFDALFQPQDHPAREMHDTFYLKFPKTAKLPDKQMVQRVSKTHENGWKTGSIGWGYKWDANVARQTILRTHTTATTIRYLAEHPEPPVKVFSVDRVYRNEKLDYKHLAEFFQIEGIIVDENVTLRDLMGTLTEFYKRLGFEKVQFWPSYFPYTEPSLQSTVYVEEFGWIELCGMGIFRPEVTIPLGVKVPVLAWGGGFERLAMLRLGLEDIRDLYKNDLGWIRRTPILL